MSRVTTTCCAHGWWWAIAYTTRIVFSAFHGDMGYTRHTDLCNTHTTREIAGQHHLYPSQHGQNLG